MDAALASALTGAADEDRLAVFVHVDPGYADEKTLHRLQLDAPVSTASLLPSEVAALTDEPGIRQVRLARTLRLLDETGFAPPLREVLGDEVAAEGDASRQDKSPPRPRAEELVVGQDLGDDEAEHHGTADELGLRSRSHGGVQPGHQHVGDHGQGHDERRNPQ